MNESKKVCFNVYRNSFVLLAGQQTWPPACPTLTSLLQHQGSADTVQDNPSGFRPDTPPSRANSAKARLSDSSKDYLDRVSCGVRFVQRDFSVPHLPGRRLWPPWFKIINIKHFQQVRFGIILCGGTQGKDKHALRELSRGAKDSQSGYKLTVDGSTTDKRHGEGKALK